MPVTLLTPADAAARLRISRSTLFAMMKRGQFVEPIRFGARSIRFPSDEVAAWIEERRAERDTSLSHG